jgi:hypothetical protein
MICQSTLSNRSLYFLNSATDRYHARMSSRPCNTVPYVGGHYIFTDDVAHTLSFGFACIGRRNYGIMRPQCAIARKI